MGAFKNPTPPGSPIFPLLSDSDDFGDKFLRKLDEKVAKQKWEKK